MNEYSQELKVVINYLSKKLKTIRSTNKIVKENSYLIYKETAWLPENSSFPERIYCIKKDILQIPKCLECGKKVKFLKSGGFHYALYCSTTCSRKKQNENMSQEAINIRSKKMSKAKKKNWKNLSDIELSTLIENLSKGWKNRPQEKKDNFSKKMSEIQEKIWKNLTQEEINVRTKKRLKTMIKNGSIVGSFSKPSQELFWFIYKQLSKELQEKTYFGELNKEFHKRMFNTNYFYDFVISSLKICIEFNGEHVHPNPSMSKDKWNKWKQLWSNQTADEVYVHDKTKLNILKNKGFNVLEIWYSDYKNNYSEVLQKCLNFIKVNNINSCKI